MDAIIIALEIVDLGLRINVEIIYHKEHEGQKGIKRFVLNVSSG